MADIFRVYRISRSGDTQVWTGQDHDIIPIYGLVYEQEFDSTEEAEIWVNESGNPREDYTILQIFRKR